METDEHNYKIDEKQANKVITKEEIYDLKSSIFSQFKQKKN